MPLRIANFNPFHLPGAPASFGACVLRPGETELILSLDIRRGLGEGWEHWIELSASSYAAGAFDGFIESWHDVFDLPQGGRDAAPRDQLAINWTKDGASRADVERDVSSPGDVALGIGRAVAFPANDGLALRAAVTLPTGDVTVLAGAGGVSAAVWAESSGRLFGPGSPRAWLYSMTLGGLVASPPSALADGRRLVAFGRLGVTWRPLAGLALKVQVDANSSRYRSALAPLGGPAVMIGMGCGEARHARVAGDRRR